MNFLKTISISTVLLFSNIANASIINQWSVSNAAGNCNGGPHGLWTNDSNYGGNCGNFFGFQTNSFLTEFDDGTATLLATAKNQAGVTAVIDINYSLLQNHTDFTGTIKGEQLGDETSWGFYTLAEGSITINNNIYTLWGDGLAGDTSLQIGDGANDKTSIFGASSWLNIQDSDQKTLSHWDLNMELTATTVPEPSILALLALGLVGIGFARKSKNQH
jgi:hypothetical protein